MMCYIYLIKFEDGTESIVVGQEDHNNTSPIDQIFCSAPQYVDDSMSLDDIIGFVKEQIEYEPPTEPNKRIIN